MEWISIKDQAPEDGQDVIYYFDVVGRHRGKYCEVEYPEEWGLDSDGKPFKGHQFYSERGFLTDDVTHWMPDNGQPLPPPPTEKGE
jgi:hypothetical protein